MRHQGWMQQDERPRELRVWPAMGDNLNTRMRQAIARRAFTLFEEGGRVWGRDAADWAKAEAHVVRPLECGTVEQDHRVCLTADTGCFGDGPIELWLEPHRLVLCGTDPARKPVYPREDWIFFTRDIPVEVDPAQVTARFNGQALTLYLPKAHRPAVPAAREMVRGAAAGR